MNQTPVVLRIVTGALLVAGLASCGGASMSADGPCAIADHGDGELLIGCPNGLQATASDDQLCLIDAQGNKQAGECYEEELRFGYGADLHYARASAPNKEYRRWGAPKLRAAIAEWNEANVDLVVMGGDYIDPEEGSDEKQAVEDLRRIERVFEGLDAPHYHALGNHDLEVLSKETFVANTSMEETYYSFERGGYRFVVLDANYSERDDDAHYEHGNYDYTDTWINPSQIDWLEDELADTERPTLVFAHQCLSAVGNPFVENAPEVRRILQQNDNVVGVFTGHAHRNDRMIVSGIPYFIMQAMTRGEANRTAHGLVRVFEEGWILVEGTAYQASYLQQPLK